VRLRIHSRHRRRRLRLPGNDLGNEGHANPRSEHAFGSMGGVRPHFFVGESDAGSKCVGELVGDFRRRTAREGTGRESDAARFIGQYGGTGRGEFEATVVVIVEELGRSLTAHPFEEPALLQSHARSEFGRIERSSPFHGLVDPEPISQMNHQGHHFALFVVPDAERKHLEFIGIKGGLDLAHGGSCSFVRARLSHAFWRRALRGSHRPRVALRSLQPPSRRNSSTYELQKTGSVCAT